MYPATDNHKRTLMIALPEDLSSLLRQSSRRWLVTGAAGFIGSNLVEALLAAGQDVVGLDNFATGHQRNLDEVARLVPGAGERFTMIQGDIRDRDACAKAVEGVDVVLHQAALGSVPRSLADPLTSHDVNVTGFLKESVDRKNAVAVAISLAGSPQDIWMHFGSEEIGPPDNRRGVRAIENLVTGERHMLEWGGVRLRIDPAADPALFFRCYA